MIVYHTDAPKNRTISRAFAEGAGAKLVRVNEGYQGGPVAVYGWTRGLWGIVEAAQAAGEPWVYLDNGYFMRGVFFRATVGALQWHGYGTGVAPHGLARLHDLDLDWQDWRASGDHVVIAQQTPDWYAFRGEGTREEWTERAVAELQRHTDREIRIRRKGERRPLESDLERAWALVTYSSNAAVDALVYGVPVFVHEGAAACMSRPLSDIERPTRYEDRIRWGAHLAANQWEMEELRNGKCWHDLSL